MFSLKRVKIDFTILQFYQIEELCEKLRNHRQQVKELLYNACLDSLLQVGYTPEDTNITAEQTAYGKLGLNFQELNNLTLTNNFVNFDRSI